jgi:hypothetical protein
MRKKLPGASVAQGRRPAMIELPIALPRPGTFRRWLQNHPEASRREAWNAAIDAAYELTDEACGDMCMPVRALLVLKSQAN